VIGGGTVVAVEAPVGLPVPLSVACTGAVRRVVRLDGRPSATRDDRLFDEPQLALRLGERLPGVGDPLEELPPEVREHVVGLFGPDRRKQSPAGHAAQRNPCQRA
jgi:hypothetical protein